MKNSLIWLIGIPFLFQCQPPVTNEAPESRRATLSTQNTREISPDLQALSTGIILDDQSTNPTIAAEAQVSEPQSAASTVNASTTTAEISATMQSLASETSPALALDPPPTSNTLASNSNVSISSSDTTQPPVATPTSTFVDTTGPTITSITPASGIQSSRTMPKTITVNMSEEIDRYGQDLITITGCATKNSISIGHMTMTVILNIENCKAWDNTTVITVDPTKFTNVAGNNGTGSPQTVHYTINPILFFTKNPTDGNMGGISGADELCKKALPSQMSSSAVVKALLVDEQNRTPPPTSRDWVLTPNTRYSYYSTSNSSLIEYGTTDSTAIFQTISPYLLQDGVARFWTGLSSTGTAPNSTWSTATTNEYCSNSCSSTCLGWNSNRSDGTLHTLGASGLHLKTFSAQVAYCDINTLRLLCVQQ
jgi:hypothetical protein